MEKCPNCRERVEPVPDTVTLAGCAASGGQPESFAVDVCPECSYPLSVLRPLANFGMEQVTVDL